MLKYILLFLLTFSAQAVDVKTYIPKQAYKYFDIIKSEQQRLLPDFPYPYYFPALIEHESCIHLKHRRCWSPTSQLKTSRELGIGYFQITKAYRKDGTLRFDTLSDLRRKYMSELKDLSWSNIKSKPELQIRAGMLLSKNNYSQLYKLTDDYQRLAAADAAYNGGLRSVYQRRRKCGLKANCDPNIWFDNLERMIVKSTKPLYNGRSAQTINDHHVRDVLLTRMPKYCKCFLDLE